MARIGLGLGLLVFSLATGCGGPSPLTPSLGDLEAAPMAATLAGKTLNVNAGPHRNLMPGATDSGLRIVITVGTDDGGALPAELSIGSVWALNGSTVWSAWTFTSGPGSPSKETVMASDGPAWDVGTVIGIVVRLHDGNGDTALVRAQSQAIVGAM